MISRTTRSMISREALMSVGRSEAEQTEGSQDKTQKWIAVL